MDFLTCHSSVRTGSFIPFREPPLKGTLKGLVLSLETPNSDENPTFSFEPLILNFVLGY